MKRLVAAFSVVLRKELVDGLRDRRSLLSVLAPLALLPLMLFMAMSQASESVERARQIKVPIVGAEHARELTDWLDQQAGIEIEQGPDQPREAVRNGDVDFVLVIPEDFAERFAGSETAEVEIILEGMDRSLDRAVGRVRDLVRGYGRGIADQRLIVRGISPEVARPVRVETIELATQQQRTAMLIGFMPLILVMGIFVGGLQVAIDSTAGERERGSLEPLLVIPVPRLSIIGGKWLAATAFSLASAVLTAALMGIGLEYSPLQRLGLRLELDGGVMALMVAAIVPLAFSVTALQMVVATLARSYKEAQSYVSFLMLLPMLPLALTMNSPIEDASWRLLVPVLAQQQLIQGAIGGEGVALVDFVVTVLVAAAFAGVCLWLTSDLFRRERIVFGR
ncbi:MAG: ABC transporter permease [Bryobacterales bacterium]|nr:ABC transporter permease [Bryobacterales bacterium]MDE0623121.1 ABC transporter permease [Bryobacterales bacterium]